MPADGALRAVERYCCFAAPRVMPRSLCAIILPPPTPQTAGRTTSTRMVQHIAKHYFADDITSLMLYRQTLLYAIR